MVSDKRAAPEPLRVAFCHPDLGLGGAERLIVDAAVELSQRGHVVDVFTAFHDPQRCFEETVGGPFSVSVHGSWFPRHILGRMFAVCAYIRCILVALSIAFRSWWRGQQYDVVFVDQVSAVIPVLKHLTSARVLFYCHFPDLLLAQRDGRLRRAYRAPLDWVEQTTTGQADLLLVNSAFTQGVFAETFTRLHAGGIQPRVLHPAVALPSEGDLMDAESWWHEGLPPDVASFVAAGPTFLSINRFERKKGIGLAIQALAALLQQGSNSLGKGDASCTDRRGIAASAVALQAAKDCRLVVAGGYDPRLPENVQHLEELRAMAAQLGVQDRVHLLPSFSDRQRSSLLAAAVAVLYTPQREHFGIVPLEAMAAARPVLACNSGGPKESVLDGKTGFLCEPDPQAWAAAMARLLEPGAASQMGLAARAHVDAHFSRAAFGDKLHRLVLDLAAVGPPGVHDVAAGSKRRAARKAG